MHPITSKPRAEVYNLFNNDKRLGDVFTGLRSDGERICNNGETVSSTKEFNDKCLETQGTILDCQDRKHSILSVSNERYLRVIQRYEQRATINFLATL